MIHDPPLKLNSRTDTNGAEMDEPKSLNSLFKGKLFRIPTYQRGYAWWHE